MSNEPLFSERQRFTAVWIWAPQVFIVLILIFGLAQQVFLDKPFGSKPSSTLGLLAALALVVLVALLLFKMQLETEIDKGGISVRFLPFQLKLRRYEWGQISKLYLRDYNPIGEFGGWGIKGFGKKKALNVAGSKGLQLEFPDGRQLLIGTQKKEELEAVLRKLGRLSEQK